LAALARLSTALKREFADARHEFLSAARPLLALHFAFAILREAVALATATLNV
jgi:hypothetical protein